MHVLPCSSTGTPSLLVPPTAVSGTRRRRRSLRTSPGSSPYVLRRAERRGRLDCDQHQRRTAEQAEGSERGRGQPEGAANASARAGLYGLEGAAFGLLGGRPRASAPRGIEATRRCFSSEARWRLLMLHCIATILGVSEEGRLPMPDLREVHVEITTRSDGRAYARSEELPGLILSDEDVDTLLPIIPPAIGTLYEYSGHPKAKVTLESSTTTPGGTTHQCYLVDLGEL